MSATVTGAVLEADGDVLVVQWTLVGEEPGRGDPGVDIGVGPTPDGIAVL